MGHGSEYDYWDRAELLETLKETYQKIYGKRPEPGLYDDLEINIEEVNNLQLATKFICKEIESV